jgi:hypothetical protein
LSALTDMIITGGLCYYLRALNPDLYRTRKMLSTIVSFADNNGALTWFADKFSSETQTDVDFDSLVALSTLICVNSSQPLFAIYVDKPENSGLLFRTN